MADLVSCSNCGRVNRLPEVHGARKGYFRCGACSTTVKRTAAKPSQSSSKVLNAEFTRYELSMHLLSAAWLGAIALGLGFTPWFSDFYGAIRVLPFGAAAYATYLAVQSKHTPWIWLMGGLTFFYNPLVVSWLDRVSWVMIDVASILVLLAAPFYCPVEESAQAARERIKADVSELSAG